jgi:hypothetical protein
MSYIVDNRPKIDFFTASDGRATASDTTTFSVRGVAPGETASRAGARPYQIGMLRDLGMAGFRFNFKLRSYSVALYTSGGKSGIQTSRKQG